MKFQRMVIAVLAMPVAATIGFSPPVGATSTPTVSTGVVQFAPENGHASPCEPIKTDRCQDPATTPAPVRQNDPSSDDGMPWWGWLIVVGCFVAYGGLMCLVQSGNKSGALNS